MTTQCYPGGTLRLSPRSQDRALAPSAVAPNGAPVIPKPAKAAPKAVAPDPAEIAARKRANVEHERQAHEAAVLRHREQTREILALLRARWPDLFGVHTPLATGIARAIQTELGEARLPVQALSRALHWWTQSPSYLVAAGRARRNLDGTEAGVPDEAQREAAAEALRQHALRRAAERKPQGPKPRPRPRTAPPPPERHEDGESVAAAPPPVAPPTSPGG